MSCLPGYFAPLSLKQTFDFVVTLKRNRSHFAPVMAVVVSVSRVIPENPTVIAREDQVIDIRQVVTDNPIPLV
jgi:hypothetical protein